MLRPATKLYDHNKYWAECFGVAPELPMSRAEMDSLGWDSCDIIIVTGDAYVDHPSFGMAIIGRLLEANGFRVGIIAQPDWRSKTAFEALGKPNLYFGVAAGNMDSMINRYTADKKVRNDDAYTPGGVAGKRPDRCSLVYSQRCKEAYKDVPVVLGGIEASLRRIAHYDYWQDKVRHSILMDASADISAVRQRGARHFGTFAPPGARRMLSDDITDVRGTAFLRDDTPDGWWEIDSTRIDRPGRIDQIVSPYVNTQETAAVRYNAGTRRVNATVSDRRNNVLRFVPEREKKPRQDGDSSAVVRESSQRRGAVRAREPRAASGNEPWQRARARSGARGPRPVAQPARLCRYRPRRWTTCSACRLRASHIPSYGDARIPAYEMIRFSVNIMRGCFRRLHVLLDHRTRRPNHSESLRGVHSRRGGEDS